VKIQLQTILKKKNMQNFYKINNITENDFISDCYEVLNIYSRDYLFSDYNNEILLYYNSYITKTIVKYMKERIDIDINGDNDSINPSPKMVIISGQNTTLSAQELFFIKYFNESESFIFPIYGSQISLELSRKEVNESARKNLNYSDYTISEYFNDRLVFSMNFSGFLEKIYFWEDYEINAFCHLKEEEKNDNAKILAIIILVILIVILCIIIIILIKKKEKRK